MSEAEVANQCSPSGNASPTSTQRVAKWRERKGRGVLFMAKLEVMDRDLRVLKRFGHLASDDPAQVGKDEFGDALGFLLDGLANRFGMFGAGAGHARQERRVGGCGDPKVAGLIRVLRSEVTARRV